MKMPMGGAHIKMHASRYTCNGAQMRAHALKLAANMLRCTREHAYLNACRNHRGFCAMKRVEKETKGERQDESAGLQRGTKQG